MPAPRLERRKAALALVVGAAAIPPLACGDAPEGSAADPQDCSTHAAALGNTSYNGAGLPPKTLALTFDDGPGPRTAELSHYLNAHGVRAAFFVNGRMLKDGTAILAELVADGHMIGNHTQTHADLTTIPPEAVITEVEETDALIAPFVPEGRFLFRPPYGAYTVKTWETLASSTMKKYVGPIDWDLGSGMGPDRAADWDCWSPSGTSVPPVIDPIACGNLYLEELHARTSGIVLMHDPWFIDNDPAKGGTIDMIEYILPVLLFEGFHFVRIDEVPAIASALAGGPSGDSREPCGPSPRIAQPNSMEGP
jgi:peptidoglycan/xylan/chitin deacetylase (PgdA/CDA1 family)